MSCKKIAIISNGFQFFYLDELFRLFAQENYQIDFYANSENHRQYSQVENIYYFKSQISETNPELIEKLSQELELLMQGKNYDYILSDCCAIRFGCTVFHRHSLMYRQKLSPNFIYEFFFKLGHFKKLNYFKKWHTKKHQKIFVVSNEMKKDYSKAYAIPEEKIHVLIPGFNFDKPDSSTPKVKNKNEEFVLGLSAVGFSSKGGYILLDAMRRIKNKNIKCKIIYPKHEKNFFLKFLVKIIGIEEKIEFLGYQKDMTEFYNSIDCLVVSSLAEAFGRVILEAMINKKPVILGSNVGAADIIEDGKNGFIYEFNKKSGQNLASKIEEVYKKRNGTKNLTEKAYNIAISLSWDNFAKKMFEEISK